MTTVSAKSLAQECESAMSALARTTKLLGEACRRAHCDADDFVTGGASGDVVSGSREADRATAGKAIGQWKGSADQEKPLQYSPDPVRSAATRLADSLYAANHAAGLALLAASSLIAMDPKKVAIELGDTPATCLNCGRDVWCGPADRLRRGRCDECYMWAYRHGGEERPSTQWEEAPRKVVTSNGESSAS